MNLSNCFILDKFYLTELSEILFINNLNPNNMLSSIFKRLAQAAIPVVVGIIINKFFKGKGTNPTDKK